MTPVRRAEQVVRSELSLSQKYGWLLDQQLAAYNLAGYGLGAAFISDTLALQRPAGRTAVLLPASTARTRVRTISLFYKRTRALTAPMRAMLTMLKPPEGEERVFRQKIPNA